MRYVWLKARTAVTVEGVSYAAGQMFMAQPIPAVRLVHARQASYAKASEQKKIDATPVTPHPEPEATPRRRVGRPRKEQEAVVDEIHASTSTATLDALRETPPTRTATLPPNVGGGR